MTIVSASNMDLAAKQLQILKHGCFTHIFNLAEQKIDVIITVSRMAPKISVTNDATYDATVKLASDVFGYEMSSLHHFILSDVWCEMEWRVKFCHN